MWDQGLPHGQQSALEKELWHLAQAWPWQHPGLLRTALHPAVPIDPGTMKQCWGPRVMPHVGLGCCPHPCMGQKWGARLSWGCHAGPDQEMVRAWAGVTWTSTWCRTGLGMPSTRKDRAGGALHKPGVAGSRMPGPARDWTKSVLPQPGMLGTNR